MLLTMPEKEEEVLQMINEAATMDWWDKEK